MVFNSGTIMPDFGGTLAAVFKSEVRFILFSFEQTLLCFHIGIDGVRKTTLSSYF
jgi:hypothetical protein